MRIGEPVKTATGWVMKAVPLKKWTRKYYGLTSFLVDLIELRKTICLCASCEYRMPVRWKDRYNYQFVRGFHAEANACDRCRAETTTNMYVAMEGRYAQQVREEKRSMAAIKRTERALYENDQKYLLRRG